MKHTWSKTSNSHISITKKGPQAGATIMRVNDLGMSDPDGICYRAYHPNGDSVLFNEVTGVTNVETFPLGKIAAFILKRDAKLAIDNLPDPVVTSPDQASTSTEKHSNA